MSLVHICIMYESVSLSASIAFGWKTLYLRSVDVFV